MTVPASRWQLKNSILSLDDGPIWMGILNVTPDSFSDGGKFVRFPTALEHARELLRQGAGIIDIGGESTRPYSEPVEESQEIDRVLPVIEQLRQESDVLISVDTSKANVAMQAVAAGADIINDVTGLEGDPRMMEVARTSGAGICAMHMQGTPQTMQDNPHYEDVVQEIFQYLEQRRDALVQAGIALERICLDPGVGFGKSHQHNLDLVAGAATFHQLGCPILVGHSRKGFIGTVLRDRQCERDSGTAGVSIALAMQGVQIIRVHDVASSRRAWQLFQAVGQGSGGAIRLSSRPDSQSS